MWTKDNLLPWVFTGSMRQLVMFPRLILSFMIRGLRGRTWHGSRSKHMTVPPKLVQWFLLGFRDREGVHNSLPPSALREMTTLVRYYETSETYGFYSPWDRNRLRSSGCCPDAMVDFEGAWDLSWRSIVRSWRLQKMRFATLQIFILPTVRGSQ